MKNRFLWIAWTVLYVACVALGTVTQAEGLLRWLLVAIGVAFFLPGAVLLYRGIRNGERKTVLAIRYMAAGSLILTVCTLLVTFLSADGSAVLGMVLQGLLALVSAPMLCIRYWVLSLFLWACLLFGSFSLKKGRNS